MKKIQKLLFTLMVLTFTMLAAASVDAAKPTIRPEQYFYTTAGKQLVFQTKKGDVIKSVRSSKKSVATVKKGSVRSRKGVVLTPKKTGITTITIKVKRNKKTYTLRTKAYVMSGRPFNKLYIGDNSLASKVVAAPGLAKAVWYIGKNVSGELKLETNSNWTISRIAQWKLVDSENVVIQEWNVNEGDTVTLDEDTALHIYLYNKTSKHTQLFTLKK